MKKIYIGSTLLALMLSGQSCSENYDIYPEEYAKVVMIKDAGENPLSVYSTDDKVGHKFVVMKGGHTEEAATATLRAMTSEEFTTYQAESGKPYAMLPADCYSFSADGQTTSAVINFAPNETYKEVEVFINADALGTFMETFDGSLYSPVVPVVLESSDASVNSYGSESFILPTYSEPTLLISGPSGSNNTFSLGQLGDGKFSATVTLPIPNQWDITYQVAIDEAVVGRYNAANGTSYVSIDPAAISGETTFTLPAGTNSMDISLNIDPSYITDCDVVVPLRIVSTNVDGIDPDDAQGWTLGTTRIALTVDMLSSNAVEPTEGSLANLLDGDPSHLLPLSLVGGSFRSSLSPDRTSPTPTAGSRSNTATVSAQAPTLPHGSTSIPERAMPTSPSSRLMPGIPTVLTAIAVHLTSSHPFHSPLRRACSA